MKKLLFLVITILSFSFVTFTPTKLSIKHGDMKLYLDSDYNSFLSVHDIEYSEFKKLDSDRDNKWFQDKYKGVYNKESYKNSGYDLGHLTPSHITSYNDTLNHNSFSLFNQAPQLASFNRGKWSKLEKSVEDSISKYQSNATILTGVIYDNNNKTYLGKSKIKIPISYYKILSIKKKNKVYVWVGSNVNGNVIEIDIKILNQLLKSNGNVMSFTSTN